MVDPGKGSAPPRRPAGRRGLSAVRPSVLLVGGGRMGAAMLAGWREQGKVAAVVVDPSPLAAALAGAGVTVVPAAADIPADYQPAAVVLAVKPQSAAQALPDYGRYAGAVFISIMAGQTAAAVGELLGRRAAVVRAMPNTPAALRQGITVAFAAAGVVPPQRALANALLTATGRVAWVEDEALLDPVTAISGGGPAYLFLLTELMEQAALTHGIAPDLARLMARQTIIGSAALLAAGDEDAARLREAVTSPNGTTERALAVLRAPEALPKLFAEAIEAAIARSRELSAG